jgi:hypothetical protein
MSRGFSIQLSRPFNLRIGMGTGRSMDLKALSRNWLGILLACLLAACSLPSSRTRGTNLDVAAAALPLQPGDTINGTSLSTGGEKVVSVWTICRPTAAIHNVTGESCAVPDVEALAIGPTTFALGEAAHIGNLDQWRWSLALDDRPVNLDAFGTFNALREQKGGVRRRCVPRVSGLGCCVGEADARPTCAASDGSTAQRVWQRLKRLPP